MFTVDKEDTKRRSEVFKHCFGVFTANLETDSIYKKEIHRRDCTRLEIHEEFQL